MSEPTMGPERPTVLTLVSGKGGVGKTMLAVALARELSLQTGVLLVDLDFFNRGASGLFRDSSLVQDAAKLAFLPGTRGGWEYTRVEGELYFLRYPDLLPEEVAAFERQSIEDIERALEKLIRHAADVLGCEVVVLDCHGGPDTTSFAACRVGDHNLLISEPDRITFHGSLNFLRQLRQERPEDDHRLSLVFNKVVPAFSGRFLQAIYRRLLQDEFDGRDLVAVLPMEVYLTKGFERTPLLTKVYPKSWLARKTRLILRTLFEREVPTLVRAGTRRLPRWLADQLRVRLPPSWTPFSRDLIVGCAGFLLLLLVLSGFVMALSAGRTERVQMRYLATRTAALLVASDLRSDSPGRLLMGRNAASSVSSALADGYRRFQRTLEYSEEEESLRRDLLSYASGDTAWWQLCNSLDERPRRREICVALDQSEGLLAGGLAANWPRVEARIRSLAAPESTYALDPNHWQPLREEILESRAKLGPMILTAWTVQVQGRNWSRLIVSAFVVWLSIAILFDWSVQLERRFLYTSRQRRLTGALGLLGSGVGLWSLTLVFLSVFLPAQPEGALLLPVVQLSLVALLLLGHCRAWAEYKFEGWRFEPFGRTVAILLIVAVYVACYWAQLSGFTTHDLLGIWE